LNQRRHRDLPLIAVALADHGIPDALGKLDCELLHAASPNALLTADFPRHPRLFVIHVAADQAEPTETLLHSLRASWPLTDVLLWAPQAGGGDVRRLFRAGARDVLVQGTSNEFAERAQEILASQRILPRLDRLSRQRLKGARFASMLSRSAPMWDLFELCQQVAPTEATVLIVGETGTGKELLARAIHRYSERSGRFVAANCASIAPELINSELFGHEKGAFTGADRRKKGLVVHAHHGTLFLDEIGDMPPETQVSLLRMLQEKQVRPVGSVVETRVDVRIIAATNAALDQAVRDGDFREDLFYRLDVIRMNVPALRDRPEDILFLFGHFTKQLARHYGLDPPTFSNSFLDALTEHDWPGNVRQLENFSERLVLSRIRRALTADDFGKLRSHDPLDAPRAAGQPHRAERSPWSLNTSQSLDENLTPLIQELERQYLHDVLQQNAGRVAASARQAGISRRTLLRKMRQYEIDKQQFRE